MPRPLLFASLFPAYHPRKGAATEFERKILHGLRHGAAIGSKLHTIRAGHRWSPGDLFMPKMWTGKPYRSKQRNITDEPLEVVSTWDFTVYKDRWMTLYLDGREFIWGSPTTMDLAHYDGLKADDFFLWFHELEQDFDGQIICWHEDVKY